MKKMTRRALLITGAAAGGGLAVGAFWPVGTPKLSVRDGESMLNAWVKLASDGRITLMMPQAEMGQGAQSGMAQILAEEMDARLSDISLEPVPVHGVYANVEVLTAPLAESGLLPAPLQAVAEFVVERSARLMAIQLTGGSSSIRAHFDALRHAGAAARSMLLAAAANRLGVRNDSLVSRDSRIFHFGSGESCSFGELANHAAKMPAPDSPQLKTRDDWTLLGRPAPRLDARAKSTGQADFGLDARPDGLKYAAMARRSGFDPAYDNYDDSTARQMPGVLAFIPVTAGIAVVAETAWHARRAADTIRIIPEKPAQSFTNDTLQENLAAAIERNNGFGYQTDGKPDEAFASADRIIEQTYSVPALAHACMEPMNATAHLGEDRCDIWIGHQSDALLRRKIADYLELDQDDVHIHPRFLGGGFGRRIEMDVALEAVEIARQIDGPVQLLWSRAEDLQHDFYRPPARARMRAALKDGALAGVEIHAASPSVTHALSSRIFIAGSREPDTTSVEGLAGTAYDFGAYRLRHTAVDLPLPAGIWRSVGHSINAFFMESFLDEIAYALGINPLDMRLRLLPEKSREARLLRRLADISGYGADDRVRGLAIHHSFETIVGQVVDLQQREDGLSVPRVTCVVDCGVAVNPDQIRAQMEGAVIFAMGAAFFGKMHIEGGAVRDANFDTYRMVRMPAAPEVEVDIIAEGDEIGGIGEPGVPPFAPALCNAVFALTGQRIRSLPLIQHGLPLSGQ